MGRSRGSTDVESRVDAEGRVPAAMEEAAETGGCRREKVSHGRIKASQKEKTSTHPRSVAALRRISSVAGARASPRSFASASMSQSAKWQKSGRVRRQLDRRRREIEALACTDYPQILGPL